jgi:hypothetical protein
MAKETTKEMTLDEAKLRFKELKAIPHIKRNGQQRAEFKALKEQLEGAEEEELEDEEVEDETTAKGDNEEISDSEDREDGEEEEEIEDEEEEEVGETDEDEGEEEEEEELEDEEVEVEGVKPAPEALLPEYKVGRNIRTGKRRYKPGDTLVVKAEGLKDEDVRQLLLSGALLK